MIVKCIANDKSDLVSPAVRERVSCWTNSEGQYTNVEIGKRYVVQAIEYLDHGMWFYLHTIIESDHPYPYASEFFIVEDSSFPANWCVESDVSDGQNKLKRITFREWSKDDRFYEKLVDGDPAYIASYVENMERDQT